jgi:hypothetical protein
MSSDKKYCPYCGKENLSFAKYCSGCGYEIPEDKFSSQHNNQKRQQDTERNSQSETYVTTQRVRKKKGYGRLIVLIALATLFIYTNPSEKMHLDFVKGKIHTELNKDESFASGLIRLIEIGIGDERTNNLLKDVVKRKNFVFFSLTEIQDKEQSQIIAIGILGNFIELEKVKNFFDKFSQ